MNYQKMLISTLAGAVVFYFAGFLIWGIALSGIQESHSVNYDGLAREAPDMVAMALSMIASAFLFAYIFDRWAGIKTFVTGAKAGALLAVFIGLGHGLLMHSMMNLIDYTVIATDVVGNAIWGALGGGVIGYLLGRGED